MLRQLWSEGKATFHGRYFDYDGVSFFSGSEMAPLMPLQSPPPIWVVSNPRLRGEAPPEVLARRVEAACRRIVRYGDGWTTCCRARHPEEVVEQLTAIARYAAEHGGDFSRLVISYQVTMNIADSEEEGRAALDDYIAKVLPGAVEGDGPVRLGPGQAPRADRRVDPSLRRCGCRALHLPVRRAGPARAGGAVAKKVLPVFSASE